MNITSGRDIVKFFQRNMNKWPNKIQNQLYPLTCFMCNQAGHDNLDLCKPCLDDLIIQGNCCDCCGVELTLTGVSLCGKCIKKRPSFDKISTLYQYHDSTQHLIHSLKYNAKYSCARTLGKLMARHFREHKHQPDALIPVPLHKKRLYQRQFNQAEMIAQHIHRDLNITLLNKVCIRHKETQSQSLLNADDRQANLRHAFNCKIIKNIDSVAIIDDVVTTGSTVNELAKTLKKAGVKRVDVWAFARA